MSLYNDIALFQLFLFPIIIVVRNITLLSNEAIIAARLRPQQRLKEGLQSQTNSLDGKNTFAAQSFTEVIIQLGSIFARPAPADRTGHYIFKVNKPHSALFVINEKVTTRAQVTQ